MPLGKFKIWMGNGEWGLINPDDLGPDVFVHESLLEKFMPMYRDEVVEYTDVYDFSRKMFVCLTCVLVVPPPPPGAPPGRRPRGDGGEPVFKYPRR